MRFFGAPLACAMLLPGLALAEPQQLASAYLFGKEVIILADGTWRFSAEGVSVAAVPATDSAPCFQLGDGQVSACDLSDDWTRTEIITDGYSEQHFYTHANGTIELSIAHYREDGHAGQIEYYGTGASLSLTEKIVLGLMGADFPQERSFVFGDTVVVETIPTPLDREALYFLEILIKDEALYFDIAQVIDEIDPDAEKPNVASRVAELTASIQVDGTSLAQLISTEDKK